MYDASKLFLSANAYLYIVGDASNPQLIQNETSKLMRKKGEIRNYYLVYFYLDQVEHSRLHDGHQPNSQSVSDDEEDMVKLDNNDLNYDDYDDYEGEARERVESNNSSVHLQHSEELKENEVSFFLIFYFIF